MRHRQYISDFDRNLPRAVNFATTIDIGYQEFTFMTLLSPLYVHLYCTCSCYFSRLWQETCTQSL
uniref:Uncharacterized protein n=1 Tax=Arion vulgaris TaxID=1028688 RepID=A0A0B6ZWK1_9EUPU